MVLSKIESCIACGNKRSIPYFIPSPDVHVSYVPTGSVSRSRGLLCSYAVYIEFAFSPLYTLTRPCLVLIAWSGVLSEVDGRIKGDRVLSAVTMCDSGTTSGYAALTSSSVVQTGMNS